MREVFASINYVINKLEEKNLFKIAQEGHDIFAAVYNFVGTKDGGLERSDDNKSNKYYDSVTPGMDVSDLYSPMDKNKQRKWRVKSEVPSVYETAPASSTGPSTTDTPSAGPSVAPESALVTITAPSYNGGSAGTSSESSSDNSEIRDLQHHEYFDPEEGIPMMGESSEESNSGTSSYEPTSTELLSDSYLLSGAREPKLLGEKVYPTSREEIQKTQEKLDGIVKNLEKVLYMGDKEEVKSLLSSFLKNKDLMNIVSDPNFESNYDINSNSNLKIEFIYYPGVDRPGLKVNGNNVMLPFIEAKTASAKKVLSMTNTFITNLENYGLKREADAMHDVFVKIANAYDLVNRPGVSVQAKKWIQDNVANIDSMTNLQLVNMMASLPLNVQTELKQIITNYKGTQGYKQNKPMGYQQPNQQGYQQGYQQQNMYQNQGGMIKPN